MAGMKRKRILKSILLCVIFFGVVWSLSGCDDNDPVGPEIEPTPTAVLPTPTATPSPETRDGYWQGTTTTTTLQGQVEALHFTVRGDEIIDGVAEIWSEDSYTADGGGIYYFSVSFTGYISGNSIICTGESDAHSTVHYNFQLEGMFESASQSSGTWHFSGTVPGDAIFDDSGVWEAYKL